MQDPMSEIGEDAPDESPAEMPMEKEDMPEGDEDEKGGKMMLTMPRGVRKFEEAEDGEEVKLMVTVRKEDGMKGCVMSIDGMKTPYAEEGEDQGDGDEMNQKPGRKFLDEIGTGGMQQRSAMMKGADE